MVNRENEGCYWVGKDGTHFLAGYSVNERIKDCNQRTSALAQQCRQSSWKRWFLSERWESIFIMEVNKEMKAAEVTREGASSTFLLDISIQQKMNVCMVPFFPIGWRSLLMCSFVQGWWMKRFVVLVVYIYIRIGQKCTPSNLYICFHYESYINKPRPWWHWVRKDGTHFFAGYSDTRTDSRVHPDRKSESSFRRQLISAPTLITPAKKTETVRGFVGLNISRLNIRRYMTFIIKLTPIQTLKSVIKQT